MSGLTLLWVLPAAGAAACALAGRLGPRAARACALAFALAHLAAAAGVLGPLASGDSVLLAQAGPRWAYGISYSLSADALSASLVLLTTFLTAVCVAASWNEGRGGGYWACFLALSSALCGVFLARDLFVFYVFWELALLPMFFIIGLWGSENRRRAAVKFFLFTFAGSVLMLLSLLALVAAARRAGGDWSWDPAALSGASLGAAAPWVLLGLLAGFAVKIPLFPLHTWLPDAHTEAPAAGSVMLAGVMLKMGVYGILRVALPIFPELTWSWLPWLGALAAANAVYGGLCAMAQDDLKRLVAYSSVAHLGFCVLGVLSRTSQGLAGASLQMINHGLTTGALFLLVGFLYERTHTRRLSDYGGLAGRAPMAAFFFAFSTLASIGLPGLNGFAGEFLCLSGIAAALPVLALAGAAGAALAAGYALPAFQAVFWGAEGPASARVGELDGRERGILWLLCGLMLAIGLSPGPLLSALEPALRGLAR